MRILFYFILVLTSCSSNEVASTIDSQDSITTEPITPTTDTIPTKPTIVDTISSKSKTAKKDTLKPPKPAGGKKPGDKGGSNSGDGQGAAGSGTSVTAATMAQTLSRMEAQLTKLSLTGSQDHDYLVKMMSLSYQATKKMEQKLNAGEETGSISNDFSNQSKVFNSAGSLLRTVDPGSGETRIPVTFKAEESKSIDHIYQEMRSLSNRVIASSENASVISFAEKTVRMTSSALN